MTEQAKGPRGRLKLVLIAATFLGPLALATWLYYGGKGLQPEGRANHGILLEPFTKLSEALPNSAFAASTRQNKHWRLVYVNTAPCDDACRQGLYTIRQIRLMLGREMDRVERVFLHGDAPLDSPFLTQEHKGLATLGERALAEFLEHSRPESTPGNGYYLIDPLGNLVLYFPPGIPPRDMVSDLKRLLRLSSIG